jgi:aryl-alcohol dehydrogenase-like predicted oxidoreductase
MRHVRLGRTGLPVSRLCLGTMTFGLQCDEAASVAILDRAAAGGITFLDASDVYPIGGNLETVGRTEEILGRWLHGRRHDFVLATKCFGAMSARPWDQGLSRRHILDAIEGSLHRLRTTTSTSTSSTTPIRRRRSTRPCGRSTTWCARARRATSAAPTTSPIRSRALGRSELLGLARLDCVQPRYNLLFRQVERELFPLCAEEGRG